MDIVDRTDKVPHGSVDKRRSIREQDTGYDKFIKNLVIVLIGLGRKLDLDGNCAVIIEPQLCVRKMGQIVSLLTLAQELAQRALTHPPILWMPPLIVQANAIKSVKVLKGALP